MAISAEEWQLVSFFEVEPTLEDPDVPWIYNTCVYRIERDGLKLTCMVAPSYRDARIEIRRGDAVLYEFSALGLSDIKYESRDRRESLLFEVSETQFVTLHVRPSIRISQEVQGCA
jgi:hypothetical protein